MAAQHQGALSTPPRTPPPSTANFDIVSHYHTLLSTDSTITPPIAAIESLISLLSTSPIRTVSETLSLLSTASSTLLASQQNPLPVSAGTDLFQRYLITSFNQTPVSPRSGSDFNALRNQLITNSKLFVARAKQARAKIAHYALPLFGSSGGIGVGVGIGDDSNSNDDTDAKTTVITFGSSRVVSEVLRHAAEKGKWLNVIHVLPSSSSSVSSSSSSAAVTNQVATLRKLGVRVATIPISHVDIVLNTLPTDAETRTSSTTFFLLGTGAVLENGSAVSGVGSALLARVAKIHEIPLYVVAESYKFVRQFPLGYGSRDLERMGTKQDVLTFTVDTKKEAATTAEQNPEDKQFDWTTTASTEKEEDLVDITPPDLIHGLVTENGVMTPNAVAEELIKLWF